MRKKILFFRPDHIGDLLLTTPAIHSLKKSIPDVHLTLAVGSWSADILKYNPYIDEITIIDLPWLARGVKASYNKLIKNIFQLRSLHYDHVFSFRVAAKSALVSFFIGGKKRWGFDVTKSKWAFTENVHYDKKKHVVENYLDLLEAFGAKRENNGLEIFVSDEERDAFSRQFTLPEKYVIISPGAGFLPKLWLSERWMEIADWMSSDIPVIITGGALEKPIASEIVSKMKGKCINLCGKLTVRELAILIEKSKLLITVDSAAVHLAAALKTPMVALFGFTDPVQWGPYPARDTQIVIYKKLKNKKCANSMKGIDVKDVIKAAEYFLFK